MESLMISRRPAEGFEVYRNTQGTVHLKLFVGGGAQSYYLSMYNAAGLARGQSVLLPEEGTALRLVEEEIGDGFDLRSSRSDGAVYTYALSTRDGGKLCEALGQAAVAT